MVTGKTFRLRHCPLLLATLLACDRPAASALDAGVLMKVSEIELNDVSVLLPLPANVDERALGLWLLPPSGSAGPGFPSAFVGELPPLNADVPKAAGYPTVLIVGLRFDPCFQTDTGCQAQLRLVGQPIQYLGGAPSMLEDSAVHLFYELNAAEARSTLEALVALRSSSPVTTSGRLRVHPGLAHQGWGGPLATQLRSLVTTHCRIDNLIRLTLNVFAMDNWSFHRYEVVNGSLVKQTLKHLATPDDSQGWFRQAERDDTADPSGTVSPPPSGDDFSALLSATAYSDGKPVNASAAAEAAKALLRIENPRTHTAESTDCVSCHLTSSARRFAQRHGVSFSLPERYESPVGLDTTIEFDSRADGNLGLTIQFGYHANTTRQPGTMPVISERVSFETAEVVARLRSSP